MVASSDIELALNLQMQEIRREESQRSPRSPGAAPAAAGGQQPSAEDSEQLSREMAIRLQQEEIRQDKARRSQQANDAAIAALEARRAQEASDAAIAAAHQLAADDLVRAEQLRQLAEEETRILEEEAGSSRRRRLSRSTTLFLARALAMRSQLLWHCLLDIFCCSVIGVMFGARALVALMVPLCGLVAAIRFGRFGWGLAAAHAVFAFLNGAMRVCYAAGLIGNNSNFMYACTAAVLAPHALYLFYLGGVWAAFLRVDGARLVADLQTRRALVASARSSRLLPPESSVTPPPQTRPREPPPRLASPSSRRSGRSSGRRPSGSRPPDELRVVARARDPVMDV